MKYIEEGDGVVDACVERSYIRVDFPNPQVSLFHFTIGLIDPG